MKIDLKKELKQLYTASLNEVSFVRVPELRIISVTGRGDPNTSEEFKNAVEALFSVAYAIKFAKKRAGKDHAVMPLEGLWWTDDMRYFSLEHKDIWQWNMLIVQPDTVSDIDIAAGITAAGEKKDLPSLGKVTAGVLDEGSAAQVMHVGPYASEAASVEKLHNAIKEKGGAFNGVMQKHHEIYLSDMRRTAPEKLKTIIRQPFI